MSEGINSPGNLGKDSINRTNILLISALLDPGLNGSGIITFRAFRRWLRLM